MTSFPAGTPTLAQVRNTWNQFRGELEYRYIREVFQNYADENRKRGVTVDWLPSSVPGLMAPTGYKDADVERLVAQAKSTVASVLDLFESGYAPYFDAGQQSALEGMITQYSDFMGRFDELHRSPHRTEVDELTAKWKEKAADPFRDEFMVPLPGAIARHSDMSEYLRGALLMEAALLVRVRQSFAELPLAACRPGNSHGEGKTAKDVNWAIGLASGVLGVFTAGSASVVLALGLGLVGVGSALLDKVIVETNVQLSIPDTSKMKFQEFVNTVAAAISAVAKGLDEGRKKAAEDLQDSNQAAEYDLKRWGKKLPPHYVPGAELLE